MGVRKQDHGTLEGPCHIIGAGLVPDGRAGGPSEIKVILKACGRQDQLELGDRS